MNQASLYGRSQLKIESVKAEDSGNYTCVIENTELLDSISYSLKVQGIHIGNKTKQDCLLQGQAQLDQRVVFRFSTLRLRSKKQ